MKRHFAVACLVLATAGPAFADVSPPKVVSVPFELLPTKHMAIRIKVNGKGPYRVIFDTGAPVNLLNTRIARESGLLGKDAPVPLFTLFGSTGEVHVKDLEVGGVKAHDVPAIVMNHPTVELIGKVMGPIEGIVGFPFFARYRTTVDYQARRLTFTPNGFRPPDTIKSILDTVMAVANDAPAKKVLAPSALWGLVLRKADGDPEAGVTVGEVLPQSAAAAAGVRAGDRLLTLDGRWTDSLADAYLAAGYVQPGTPTALVIRRDGKQRELTVTPQPGM
jgi:hypothetical protein